MSKACSPALAVAQKWKRGYADNNSCNAPAVASSPGERTFQGDYGAANDSPQTRRSRGNGTVLPTCTPSKLARGEEAVCSSHYSALGKCVDHCKVSANSINYGPRTRPMIPKVRGKFILRLRHPGPSCPSYACQYNSHLRFQPKEELAFTRCEILVKMAIRISAASL